METQQTFPVTGGECNVSIETTVDDVVVTGWDQPRLGVSVSADQVAVHLNGTTFGVRPVHDGETDFAVFVPQDCNVRLHLVSGDLEINNVTGTVQVQTMSGDVDIRALRGVLTAQSVSGDISVRESSLRELSVEAVSGDTSIESALDAEGSYHARSISGDLILRVPENQRFTVVSRSLSGDIRTKLPHETKRQGWGRIESLINGGGVLFDVTTTSGDVRVESGGVMPAPDAQGANVVRETKPLRQQPPDVDPFEVDEKPLAATPSRAEQRMGILKAIEAGELSVNEGLARLREI